MISKELFIETINFIKEREEAEQKMTKIMSYEFGDAIFWPYMKYEGQLIKVLENALDTDMVSWYIYESQYGERYQYISEIDKDGNKVPIMVKTSEQLYNYIIKEFEEKNKKYESTCSN